MKKIENNLRKFREIEPDEKFWHVSKSILLNKIEKDLSSNKKQRLSFESFAFDFVAFSKTIFPGWKFVSVAMSFLVALSGTFIGAQAAMPGTALGNILYPVKTQVIEPAQLALAKDDLAQTSVLLSQASERLKEINYLIDNNKEDQIEKVSNNMQKSLSQANDNLESIKNSDVPKEELVKLAGKINENSDQTLSSLKDKVAVANPKALENIIKSTQQLNTAALEIMIKSNPDQELVNKSLNNQIELQLKALDALGSKIYVGKQTLDKTNELSTTTTSGKLNTENKPASSIVDINKQEIEFSIDSIEKVVDTKEINSLLEQAKNLLDHGETEESYVIMNKVALYLNIADKTLDAQNYEAKLRELQDLINKAQVKSVTEQKSQ